MDGPSSLINTDLQKGSGWRGGGRRQGDLGKREEGRSNKSKAITIQ